MNAPERFVISEEIPSVEQAALFDFRDGFARLRKLAEQHARGADVGPELEEAREELFGRLEKAMKDIQTEGEEKGRQGELPNV